MMPRFARLTSSALLLATLCGGMPLAAFAATPLWGAHVLSVTGNSAITMAPGSVQTVTVTTRNTGAHAWVNDGASYISLYTWEPRYRMSAFDPGNWLSARQVRRLIEPRVAPGGTGTFRFDLHAPQTPGVYREPFVIAAEDTAWLTGGTFTLNITVAAAPVVPAPVVEEVGASEESAEIVNQSITRAQANAGRNLTGAVVVRNTGSDSWESVTLVATNSDARAARHPRWQEDTVAAVADVDAGAEVTLPLLLAAPAENGAYALAFAVMADGEEVATLAVDLTVVGGRRARRVQPVIAAPAANLIDEPTLRVGVLIVDEETQNEIVVRSNESAIEVRDTSGRLIQTFAQGESLRAAYDGARYAYGSGSNRGTSDIPLRFVPTQPNAVLEIANFDRRVTRGTSFANNTFRNVLEIRYNAAHDRTWVINELPMEYYLRGLAETSNVSPQEFQRALLTAARTYAWYHWIRATKHAAEGFHVDAYRDQVYWGYGQEERTPNITAAVQATRGRVVTYNGEVAITPYFSRSDGRTRDWSAVWGGNIPWAQAVEVPCDRGRTLWGHGVGMSASGALCMANDGQSWEAILRYFYTGIAIEQRWR